MELSKSDIRKIALEQRKALTEEDVHIKSLLISEQYLRRFTNASFKNIHIFLPMTKTNEVNTFYLIEKLKTLNPACNIIVPKVMPNTNDMLSILFKDEAILENKWGIPEPLNNDIIDPKLIDVIIMPLLAYDLKGNRVGYGKGFYDKFLNLCKNDIIKIGFSFDKPINTISNIEAHDQTLNHIITPEGILDLPINLDK